MDRIDRRGLTWLNVLGVLRPGVDPHQADNEMNLLMQRLVAQYPQDHRGANQISSDPLWRSPFGANVYMAGTLPILLALAAVLLLLACANVANLLLVRSVARRREFAIRLIDGRGALDAGSPAHAGEHAASRWLAGPWLFRATVWTSKTLGAFLSSSQLPLAINGEIDRRVMLATILVSLLTALVSGAVPALRASQLSPGAVLKDEALSTSGGLHKSRLTSGLVVAQIALSLLLLTCAGLFVRSLEKAQQADPGFDPNHLLLVTFDLQPMGYTEQTGKEFERQVLDAGEATARSGIGNHGRLRAAHASPSTPTAYFRRATCRACTRIWKPIAAMLATDYLATLRTPLLAGRDFN